MVYALNSESTYTELIELTQFSCSETENSRVSHLRVKVETHCMIFGCPRQKIGIMKQSWRIRKCPQKIHDASLLSGTDKNHAVCLGLKSTQSWLNLLIEMGPRYGCRRAHHVGRVIWIQL